MADYIPSTKYPAKIEYLEDRVNIARSRSMSGRLVTRSFGGSVTMLSVVWPLLTKADLDELYGFLAARSDGTIIYFDTHDRRTPRGVATGSPIIRNRQNLLTYSDDLTNAAWTKTRVSAVVINSESPVGPSYSRLTEDTSINTHYSTRSVNVTSGIAYTHSFFARSSTRNVAIQASGGLNYSVTIDMSTGQKLSVSGITSDRCGAIPYNNGWMRLWANCNASLTGAASLWFTLVYPPASLSYQGSGSDYADIAGAQFEAGYSGPGAFIGTTATSIASQSQSGATIYTDGWTPSTNGIIKAGDLIKIAGSDKCYMTSADANSSVTAASISLTSPLVVPPSNGAIITTSNNPISVVLTSMPKYIIGVDGFYSLAAEFEECW